MERFDVVVIGSGFGGGGAAARLAEGSRKVLVLERGRPWPPGSFPRSPFRAPGLLWDPERGRHGIFDVRRFDGFGSVVGSGLGGTSLLYANVALRKDPATFADRERWPLTAADLAPHYKRVEDMQRPVEYPWTETTAKARELRAAGARLGAEVRATPLMVEFGDAPGVPFDDGTGNLHGRVRRTCTLCGECDVGCRAGAKHTVDYTFLTAAQRAGAQIRCLCEARAILPDGDGYRVRYVQHVAGRDGADPGLLDPAEAVRGTVYAREVVLAAGTFGTVKLLLENRAALGTLSPRLGHDICCNGDALAFVRRTRAPLEPSHGPVITSTVARRDHLIQDAGAPVLGDWLWHLLDGPDTARAVARALGERALRRLAGRRSSSVAGVVGAALGDGRARQATNMLPLLGMGRDRGGGRAVLRGGDLAVRWSERDSRAYYEDLEQTVRDLARELGGKALTGRLGRMTTNHPLGGAVIAEDPADGVCDPYGRVFGHPRLHVVDGAAMPGPVGVNPSLTIAAFADRAAEAMLA